MPKIERFNKKELIVYCKAIGIDTNKKSKNTLVTEIENYRKKEIQTAIQIGTDQELLFLKIAKLAETYVVNLRNKIDARKQEMRNDNNAHYLIYRVLGISTREGQLIDEYQNTGRFLYKYAGSFLEEAASLCLKFKNVDGGKTLVKNMQGPRLKTFEIDFLDNINAIEIKWRDATTDGDHITKEHTRVKVIKSYGYTPIRVMFFYPQRAQAIRIQETLRTIYSGLNGQYYAGEDAWNFIANYTGYNLKSILIKITNKQTY